MTAAKLIAIRLVIAIVAVAIFQFSAACAVTAMALFVVVELIDWADGLVAEHQGQPKPFGGFLDISADQCIETLFWFLFLKNDIVPIWIPAVILIRNSFINLLRVRAIASGQDMFGANGMLHSRFAKILVGTRWSRGTMVAVKTIGFTAAMLFYVRTTYGDKWLSLIPFDADTLHVISIAFLTVLVVIHVVRGAIIVSEARNSLTAFLWNAPQATELDNAVPLMD